MRSNIYSIPQPGPLTSDIDSSHLHQYAYMHFQFEYKYVFTISISKAPLSNCYATEDKQLHKNRKKYTVYALIFSFHFSCDDDDDGGWWLLLFHSLIIDFGGRASQQRQRLPQYCRSPNWKYIPTALLIYYIYLVVSLCFLFILFSV